NVKSSGPAMELPYVCATVVPDGSDMGLFGMVQEIPFDRIRIGMRVEAVWDDEPRPDLASIKWWRPTGEPDAQLGERRGARWGAWRSSPSPAPGQSGARRTATRSSCSG